MSGIIGLFKQDGRPVEQPLLARMVDLLAHRGPDGSDLWHAGPVGLGHRMLHTTPESLHEAQPVRDAAADLVLTADARIDNRDELLRRLDVKPSGPGPVTDSALILAAYKKWGTACPEKLLGDFAFAIWDGRARRLFCARDPFGVKPFYYHHTPGKLFAFASEIKALFLIEDVSSALDEVEVGRHLLVPVQPDPTATLYADIRRVAPGHCLLVDAARFEARCYWSLDPTRTLQLGSDEEYAEAFREHFTEAVRCRLRSAFPAGAMLSGGLDSSSITCVAAHLGGQPGGQHLHTFSAVFDDVPASDEQPFIETVTAKYDLTPHYLHADRVSPLSEWQRILWHEDVANFGANLYISWHLYRQAQAHGVRVILDGFDGDTTVSHGTGYLDELAHARRWLRLLQEVGTYARRLGEPWPAATWAWLYRYRIAPVHARLRRALRKAGRLAGQPASAARHAAAPLAAQKSALNPHFAEMLSGRLDTPPAPPRTERENHHRLLSRVLLSDSLHLLDAAGSAYGIELRFPFFDRRLVEFCLSLPPEQKLHNGWSRLVMRRAMAGLLPEQIQWRERKSDLSHSFDYGLRKYERARMAHMIASDMGGIGRYVDLGTLQQTYERYVAEEATQDEAVLLWRSLSLALWLAHKRAPHTSNGHASDGHASDGHASDGHEGLSQAPPLPTPSIA